MLSNETLTFIQEQGCTIEGYVEGYPVVYDTSEDMKAIFHLAAALVTPRGEGVILVGKEFYNLSDTTQKFILYHEIAHLELGHRMSSDNMPNEYKADEYASKHAGLCSSAKAITDIADVVINSDYHEDTKKPILTDLYMRLSKITERMCF